MTTERKSTPRGNAISNPTSYMVAALATTYLVAWWAFAMRVPSVEPELAATSSATAVSPTPRAVWYDELPVERRPTVELPPGVRLVERTARPTDTAATRDLLPRPVRVAAVRRGRIRTRSS